jgi:hypothetical protein
MTDAALQESKRPWGDGETNVDIAFPFRVAPFVMAGFGIRTSEVKSHAVIAQTYHGHPILTVEEVCDICGECGVASRFLHNQDGGEDGGKDGSLFFGQCFSLR